MSVPRSPLLGGFGTCIAKCGPNKGRQVVFLPVFSPTFYGVPIFVTFVNAGQKKRIRNVSFVFDIKHLYCRKIVL